MEPSAYPSFDSDLDRPAPRLLLVTDGATTPERSVSAIIEEVVSQAGWRIQRTAGREHGWFVAEVESADVVAFLIEPGGSSDLPSYVAGYCEAVGKSLIWLAEAGALRRRGHLVAIGESPVLVWSDLGELEAGLSRVLAAASTQVHATEGWLTGIGVDLDALPEADFLELVVALLRASGQAVEFEPSTSVGATFRLRSDEWRRDCSVGRDVERWISGASRHAPRSELGPPLLVPRPAFYSARGRTWLGLAQEGVAAVLSPRDLIRLLRSHPQLVRDFSNAMSRARRGGSITSLYRQIADLEEQNSALLALQEVSEATLRSLSEEATYSAAHKLRNPLHAIETALANCNDVLGNDANAVLEPARSAVERAKVIMQRFVDLAQHGSEADVRAVDLNPLLDRSLETLRSDRVRVKLDCPEGLVVLADPDLLVECVEELSVNSLHWMAKAQHLDRQTGKTTRSRYVRVTVSTEGARPSPSASGRWVRIEFEDNGLGIPREDLERVFFAGISLSNDGTGLGLALLRKAIEACGGDVVAEESARGAKFSMYLKRG